MSVKYHWGMLLTMFLKVPAPHCHTRVSCPCLVGSDCHYQPWLPSDADEQCDTPGCCAEGEPAQNICHLACKDTEEQHAGSLGSLSRGAQAPIAPSERSLCPPGAPSATAPEAAQPAGLPGEPSAARRAICNHYGFYFRNCFPTTENIKF